MAAQESKNQKASLCIGVMAHVDAGKTTFSEQLLYHTGSIRKLGRVDHQTAFLDSDQLERERGITIFSNHAAFETPARQYYLLDTPGHADFSAEMERAVQAMDYAVLVVSCVEGIQAHTEQVWRLLEQYRVPVFFFLNKTDRAGAQPDQLLLDLHKRLKIPIADCNGSFSGSGWTSVLVEQVAEQNEDLLEQYLDGKYNAPQWQTQLAQLVAQRKIFPCFRGSALQNEGIDEFLAGLGALTLPRKDAGGFSAVAWQVRHDARGERVVFLKIQSGVLHARDEVPFLQADGSLSTAKVNELRVYHGSKFTTIQQAHTGQLCAATGLEGVRPGDEIGKNCSHHTAHLSPMLGAKVILPQTLSVSAALGALRQLEDEDPMLGVTFEEALQEIQIRVMGEIQLEVLRQLCRQRFAMEIEFSNCRILYRETLSAPVVGYGHYEPLRHYAEVHLRLSPAPRGSGITFQSECPLDVLGQNWQNLVRTHVFEKDHKGVLTGSLLTDVTITLLNGRSHIKHTEGGDFRESTYRAIRQGLEQALANGQVVLLEPYYAFEISVLAEQVGRLMSDLQRMEATFEPPSLSEDRAVLCGRGPAAALSAYGREFLSYSRGHGVLNLRFDGYEPCTHQEQVAQEIGYDRQRDLANPSCSIFCSHGAGFPVPWYKVPNHIHCK